MRTCDFVGEPWPRNPDRYLVNEHGAVWDRKKYLPIPTYPLAGKWSYCFLRTATQKAVARRLVHNVVWETFRDPVPSYLIIRPKDGNKSNCSLSNLFTVAVPGSSLGTFTDREKALMSAIQEVASHERAAETAKLPMDVNVLMAELRRQHEMILELAIVANDVRYGTASWGSTSTFRGGSHDPPAH